jgi:hypothetical protein
VKVDEKRPHLILLVRRLQEVVRCGRLSLERNFSVVLLSHRRVGDETT